MEKEIKAAGEILANKKKFRRSAFILGMICLTLIIIFGIAFFTGAVTYHGQ